MRKLVESPLGVGLMAGLLSMEVSAVAAPPAKPTPVPPPTGCTSCEIVYTRDAKGNSGQKDLMLMRRDGTNKTLLLAGSSGVANSSPRWAPDARWVAFYTTTTNGNSVRLIRNDGTGLTTVASTCTSYVGRTAWRPVLQSNGYWLVYLDARNSDGSCIVETVPFRSNLWAVDVSLGSPVITGRRVCLTCNLNALGSDLWVFPAWSRDGSHLSALQHRHGLYDNFYIFDVTFGTTGTDPPVLVSPGWLFTPPEFDPGLMAPPVSWSHWSDSLVFRTDNPGGTHDLLKYEIDLKCDPETLGQRTVLTASSSYFFYPPQWSPDDSQLVGQVGGTGSTTTDGIYVITPGPPFSMTLIAPHGSTPVSSPDWKPPVPVP